MNTLIIVGVVAALGYFAYTQCWFDICQGELDLSPEEFNEILPGMFQGGPALTQRDRQRMADHIQSGKETVAQHNRRPTSAQNPTDSNIRSTWRTGLTGSDPRQVTRVINQAKATPAGVKQFASGSTARMSSFCSSPSSKDSPLCKSNFAMSLFAETVLGGRLSN